MYGIAPLILIVFPLLFQISVGRKSIGEDIKLKFRTVCFISLVLQIVLSYIAFALASYNFEQGLEGKAYRCGMGLLGIFALIIVFSFLILITIVIQYLIKKSYERKQ